MNAKLEFLTKHFLVVSAVSTILGAVISMIFVMGYFSAFDKNLIWVIEYPDLIKFALVGVAVFSVSATIFIGYIQDALAIVESSGKSRFFIIIIILAGLSAIYLVPAYDSYKILNFGRMWVEIGHATIVIMVSIFVFFTYYTVDALQRGQKPTRQTALYQLGFTIFLMFALGLGYGSSVRWKQTGTTEIHLRKKDGEVETFSGSKIVMILSHHVLFENNNSIFVVPASDIIRLSRRLD